MYDEGCLSIIDEMISMTGMTKVTKMCGQFFERSDKSIKENHRMSDIELRKTIRRKTFEDGENEITKMQRKTKC